MPKRSYSGGYNGSNKRYKGGSYQSTGSYKKYSGYYRRRYKSRGGRRGGVLVAYPEKKFLDTLNLFGGGAIATGGTLDGNGIILLAAGNTPSTIIGRKVTIKRISVRFTITQLGSVNAAVGNVINKSTCRILLVRDTQCNGAMPTVAQVMTAAGSTNVRAGPNMENSSRFMIVKEWIRSTYSDINYETGGPTFYSSPVELYIKWSRKFDDIVHYDNAPTGVITDLRDVNYFFIAFSSNANHTLEGITRVRFTDV